MEPLASLPDSTWLRRVRAAPEFPQPMYVPLKKLSEAYVLPGADLIPKDSISLLQANHAFIEAYMVGLNHEMARQLLWNEYPTDQRGSYFRQFWDVSSFLAAQPDNEALREKLRDIPPLDRWSPSSALGDHDARERPGEKEEEVVLVIRGGRKSALVGEELAAQWRAALWPSRRCC